MTRTAPGSLSVYRGLSSKGIGEGPRQPVTQGEQYLGASPQLAQDADLLDAIRLWMTLDSDPADHQALEDRLEAWSCFVQGDLQLVVRLVSAGTFGPRVAYFAHGRAWPLEAGPGFDPGLHIGRSEVFESPWRDDDRGRRVPDPPPELAGLDKIKAEPEVATRFLAHLLQSCVRRRPLVVLAPLSEFAVGSPLHSLLAFARGALPADLRQECGVRIYTRTPENFLRAPGAALIALPEDLQERARRIRRDARWIDRQGNAPPGEPLEPMARAYAEAVVERALRIPAGLTRFGERFRDRGARAPRELPGERDVRAIHITYNLAVALAGSAQDRSDFARNYLPRIAPRLGLEVDWQRLVTPEEWRSFPLEPLLDILFMESRDLSPGMLALQNAIERSGALALAIEQGVLDPSQARGFLRTAPGPRLMAIAQELLQVRGFFEERGPWRDILRGLLEALHRLPELAPVLVQSLVRSGQLRHPGLERMAPELVEHQDLLRTLGVPALLELAGQLETQEHLERVFDFVDLHMKRDLQPTADTLTRTGWWTAWRRMSRLAVDPEWRRLAAEAWLTSRSWTGEEAAEATLEDWKRAMEDLSGGDGPPFWRSGEGARRLWPWIPPFEEDQLVDLADLAPDLVVLAELTEVVLADPARPDVGEPVYRYLLRYSRFASSLQGDALGWIVEGAPRNELAPLDLASSLQLCRLTAGRPRAGLALEARLASILHCLETDRQAEEAVEGAAKPNLWSSPRLLGGLAAWMNKQGSVKRIGNDLAKLIDQKIDGEPDRRPRSVSRPLVKELKKRRLKRAAWLLDPGLAAEVEKESLVESVIEALAQGEWDHDCWEDLAAKIADPAGERHPLSSIAEKVREETGERRADLVRSGWPTFQAAARAQPGLTVFRPGQDGLPVFDLAASLSEPGGLGNAALGVIFSANKAQRSRIEWWDAVLRGLLTWRRHPSLDCPEDRRDVALALVVRHLEDLQAEERQVFWKAFEQRAGHSSEWNLLVGAP